MGPCAGGADGLASRLRIVGPLRGQKGLQVRIASAFKAIAAGLVMLALAGCGLSLPGFGGGDAAPTAAGAIVGEVIEVSVLPGSGAPATAAPVPVPPAAPDAAPPAASGAGLAAPAAAPVIPPALAAAAAACVRSGGRYGPRGTGSRSYACFTTPRDAGKSCSKASDCSSACLARSLSCAPLQPLFGCHEVLTDRGARVTQCLD